MNGASEGPPSETERNRGRVLAPAPLQFPAAATYFGLSHSWSGWKTHASLGLDQKGPGSKEIPRCQAALEHRSWNVSTRVAVGVGATGHSQPHRGAAQTLETGQLTITSCSQERNKLRNWLFVKDYCSGQLWKGLGKNKSMLDLTRSTTSDSGTWHQAHRNLCCGV